MNRCLFLILIFFSTRAHSQSKLTYTAGVEASILKGSSDKSNAVLFTNGLLYKNIMFGAGAGVDNYFYRSVPLFLDVRKQFGKARVQPFINASAGINFSHLTSEQKQSYAAYNNPDYKNGFYLKTSVGISVKVDNHIKIQVNGGYNYKTTKVTFDSYSYNPEPTLDKSTDIYRMNRWAFGAGLWFTFL